MPIYLTVRDPARLADAVKAADPGTTTSGTARIARRAGIHRNYLYRLVAGAQRRIELGLAVKLEQVIGSRPGEHFVLRAGVDLRDYLDDPDAQPEPASRS